ncbi:helicase-associated domain-containing protein [Aneurinibacillus sp. BA2021]|nr:helicase-associated domain-containing protein [Aneurinibacillus sp. BA2021]
MQVRTILKQINHRVMEQLAQENQWPAAVQDKGTPPIEAIAAHLTDRRVVAQVWKACTEEEKRVLLHFLFRVGEDIVTYRQMEEYAQKVSPLIVYSGLTGLRRRGLVYTLRRLWGELAYCMPEEIQTAFRSWLASMLLEQQGEKTHPVPQRSDAFAPASSPLEDVAFSVLQLHRQQPVVLTKKGSLPMKTRRLWQQAIPYPDELFLPFTGPLSLENGGREEFLLHLLHAMGLFRRQGTEDGAQYTVHKEQAQEVFCGLTPAVRHRFYQQMRKAISKVHPCYCAVFDWMETCGSHRFSLRSLQVLEAAQCDEHAGTHWETFAEEIVPLLVWCGFVTCQGEGMEAVLAWSVRPGEEEEEYSWLGTGYVQPTFEVLLLPHAPYELRWRLGAYAELEEQQEVWRFRLTKAAVQAAVREGESGDLLRDLSRIQPDVPAGVQDQIVHWLRGGSTVHIVRTVLLRCPDAATADGIAADPALSACVGERLNEQDFLVQESHLARLEKAMKQRGISINEENAAILKKDEQGESKQPGGQDASGENGYKVESVFPELSDTLPELRDIPIIWHKNYQQYHHSTLRKLMTTAQTLGIPLSVEVNGQPVEEARIVDMRTEDGSYRFTLAARERRESVRLENIGRVKLHLPAYASCQD